MKGKFLLVKKIILCINTNVYGWCLEQSDEGSCPESTVLSGVDGPPRVALLEVVGALSFFLGHLAHVRIVKTIQENSRCI